MFNKYCLPATGRSGGVVVGPQEGDGLCLIRAPLLSISSNFQTRPRISSLREHPTCTHSPILARQTVFVFNYFFFPSPTVIFWWLPPSPESQIDCWFGRGGGRLGALLLQSLSTKATKHASVNISVASAPRPESCCSLSARPSEPAIVWAFFVLCCWTWLPCCGEAAEPACMQEQRRGLASSFFTVSNGLPGVPGRPWHGTPRLTSLRSVLCRKSSLGKRALIHGH